ncbi:MAG TPA: universal stress protein, partial [Polyangiaceae bacterium]
HVEKKVLSFRATPRGHAAPETMRVVPHLRLDTPAFEIAQIATDLEADLVVVGTHGRRALSRLILGSVAESTVRLSPCPVLVVRPKTKPMPVPEIEPPCPRCVETRVKTGRRELWCAQHSERHGQRHTYHQGDRASAETNMPLVMR